MWYDSSILFISRWWQIILPWCATNYNVSVGGTLYDYQSTTGSSYAAPQVSGAIALLATHFPNHTPEQLADRLLALLIMMGSFWG